MTNSTTLNSKVESAADSEALAQLVVDLSNETDQAKGVNLIGKSIRQIASFAELSTTVAQYDKDHVHLISYYTDNLEGGGDFIWDSTSTQVENSGTCVKVIGATTGRWRRRVDVATPLMFGARGDNATNDLSAWVACASRLGLDFQTIDGLHRSYYLGGLNSSSVPNALITIDTKDNIKITGWPTMRVDNTLPASPGEQYIPIIECVDCNNPWIECNGLSDSFDITASHGPVAVNFRSNVKTVSGGMSLSKMKNGWAGFQTRKARAITDRRVAADPTWNNINYITTVENVEYGARLVGVGDFSSGKVFSTNAGRSFFVTGSSNHSCTINSKSPRFLSDVLIKAYADNVTNINVVLNQQGADGAAWPITIEHQNDTGDTTIDNVTLDVNIRDRTNTRTFVDGVTTREYLRLGSVYNLAGTLQSTTACRTDNIRIIGSPQSLGVLNGVKSAIINFPTAVSSPSKIIVDFADALRNTAGYTMVSGQTLRGKISGNLALAPVRIDLRSHFPGGGAFRVNCQANASFADTNLTDSLTREDVVLINLDNNGAGSIVASQNVYNIATGASPTVSYSISNGQLLVYGAGATGTGAELSVVVTPIGGRTI